MPESELFIEQNPGRWLVFALGGVLSEAGVQAMLTSQTVPFSISIVVAGFGAVLILVAVFWNKIGLQRTVFFGKLNGIASHPAVWIALVMILWLTTQAVDGLREMRLNNDVVATRNDEQAMAKVIDRLVMPRHLTKNQQRMMSQFLSQFPPQEFAFQLSNRDEEAGEYRVDIQQALEKGGWTLAKDNPYDYSNHDLPEGLSIQLTQTMAHAQEPYDAKTPKVDRLFMMALGLAGVRLDSSGGGSGINVTEDRFVITIGKRRMDSYQLVPLDMP